MNYQEAYNYIFYKSGEKGATLLRLVAYDEVDEGIILIKKLTSCSNEDANQLWNDIKAKYGTRETNHFFKSKEILERNEARARTQAINRSLPKCPTCSSTNLKKISATSKVVNTAVFGVFGTKRHKTFHCNNCGYEW